MSLSRRLVGKAWFRDSEGNLLGIGQSVTWSEQTSGMAKYSVNERGVAKARALIDARRYVLRSPWSDVQPRADDENNFLETHTWDEYGEWHLALTEGARDETKARYAFVFGDFRRLHRMGLIACYYRAAEWYHKEIELAAHDLLQHLDNARVARRQS